MNGRVHCTTALLKKPHLNAVAFVRRLWRWRGSIVSREPGPLMRVFTRVTATRLLLIGSVSLRLKKLFRCEMVHAAPLNIWLSLLCCSDLIASVCLCSPTAQSLA
jgi:hypothetical protein